jgi:hypothetical protein
MDITKVIAKNQIDVSFEHVRCRKRCRPIETYW